jgi:D-alanine-D-alanine ligase-like ATP-grasp enzyme
MNEELILKREQEENEPLLWKNVTVLLGDPTIEGWYTYYIPQDDLDMEEFKSYISQIKGIENLRYYNDHKNFLKDFRENPPEFVFNQCDEGYMNNEDLDAHMTAYMDMLGIPYTGPQIDSLLLTKDKSLTRGAAISVGVPVPVEIYIDENEDIESKIPDDMVYPAFCKLGNASGSTGIIESNVAKNKEEAISGLKELRRQHPTRPLLLQEYLIGREFSVAMIGNPEIGDFEIFPPVEVDYSGLSSKYPKIQLEEFKRDGNSEFWQQVREVKAELTEQQLETLKNHSKKLFIRTHCKDFARMDFRMDSKGVIKIMDVNPNCWLGGKFRLMAEWAGYTWPQVLRKIFLTCQKRYLFKKQRDQLKIEQDKIREEKVREKYNIPTSNQTINHL